MLPRLMKPLRWIMFLVVPFGAMFTLGGVWNSVLFAGYYTKHAPIITRPAVELKMSFLLAGYVVAVACMAFLFSQSFKARVGVLEGFQFGALFGLIMTLPAYLLMHAGWDVNLGILLADSAWQTFEKGLGGVVMALIFRPSVETKSA
jgi:hypothetical protein